MSKKSRKNAHNWERSPFDWYTEPLWCNRILFRLERFHGLVADPCCGLGNILEEARSAGYDTFGMDVVDRGTSRRHDFELGNVFSLNLAVRFDNVASNIPFKVADALVPRLVTHARRTAAILVRTQWVNSRWRWLSRMPLAHRYELTPRPSMPPGAEYVRLRAQGKRMHSGLQDYTWLVFRRGHKGPMTWSWAARSALADSLRITD